jgi:RNA polymerase sigma-70 factor (ECF subfamily)
MDSTSSSLLLRLRRPEEQAAWNRFIDLYTPLLYSWACRMGLPAQDAADLVQDVFVALVQKMPQFTYDPTKSFRAWLRTVAENCWRDALRKRKPVQTGQAALAETAVSGEIDALWEVEYRDNLFGRAIQIMHSDFEEKTWKACWALIVEGKSGAAVAAELGMTLDGVYAAKARVLRRLRQELDGLLD